jgi:dipeptidyl aminopeptidase/acylaminoacyl peptidase
MNIRFAALLVLVWLPAAPAATLQPVDFAAIAAVSGPRLSADGSQVVYSVGTTDLAKDKSFSHLWLASWDGSSNRQLTFGEHGESNPAFSPDGKQLAFIANRGKPDDPSQLWILDLRGGEAHVVTHSDGDISDFDWAPDGLHLVLVVDDPAPRGKDKKPADKTSDEDDDDENSDDARDDKAAPPIVITRYQFKQDIDGYLGTQHSHLALLTLGSGEITPLTSGDHDDLLPAWSPDGKAIAFVSKRGEDPDRSDDWNLYVIDAKPNAKDRQLTNTPESDLLPDWETHPAWSPDSKRIAYLHGADPKLIEYGVHQLAVIDAAGGKPQLLDATLDRNVSAVHWIDNGRAIAAMVEQDSHTRLLRFDARSGKQSVLSDGGGTVGDFDALPSGRIAMLASTPTKPYEIYALDHGNARELSKQTDDFISTIQLGRVEEISSRSADGNETHGFITYPPHYVTGKKYPTLLYLHGGPASQFEADFRFDNQLFAAYGYVVLTVNPRGSTGRGTAYSAAIFADWGNKDVADVLGAVHATIQRGIADRKRLVVGGWSYGGMLTNYVIASDTRFSAAVSGASISNILAGFGTDQYIRDYDYELGKPWEHLDVWMRISYPFLHADRIKTPTLFMGGAEDYNVPVQNVQQMYQALQSLRVPTELVIYPGQHHGLDRPSYLLDRWQRWLAWYRDHLPPP